MNEYIKSRSIEDLRNKYLKFVKKLDNSKYKITKSEVIIKLPLRINLSGCWNDTPPYSNEKIGYILNAPIKLENEYPILVTINKIKENVIILESKDIRISKTYKNIDDIQECTSPMSELALLKASIISAGIIPMDKEESMDNVLKNLGGFKLTTETKNIPIGSGLGTSSIIIMACIMAIYEYIGIDIEDSKLYELVACAEQIMTTGGGFQDQIGALRNGIKLIEFRPGYMPNISYKSINISENTKKELNDRLAIIYTGHARVAKNILQNIVQLYIDQDCNTLEILKDIGEISKTMARNLEDEKIEEFAKNLTKSHELTKKLYSGFSNKDVDGIINMLLPYISGYILCGAGGGGFLEVILKNKDSKRDIEKMLNNNVKDELIKIWNMQIIY